MVQKIHLLQLWMLKIRGYVSINKTIKFCLIDMLCSLFYLNTANSQTPKTDTLNLPLQKAEELFVKNNLQLLAQRLNVDATQALIIQARLYPNPGINGTLGAYNPDTRKWFEEDYPNAERAFQVSQLIVLSRKIHKQTNIAETNYKLQKTTYTTCYAH